MKTKHRKITGWVLSGLLSTFLVFASASGKFLDWEGKEAMFAKMGWTVETLFYVGVVEVVVAILFLVPRTAFVGTLLLTAYLGGAAATHVRIGDAFLFPVACGVVAWIALGLRDESIFRLALGKPLPDSTQL